MERAAESLSYAVRPAVLRRADSAGVDVQSAFKLHATKHAAITQALNVVTANLAGHDQTNA